MRRACVNASVMALARPSENVIHAARQGACASGSRWKRGRCASMHPAGLWAAPAGIKFQMPLARPEPPGARQGACASGSWWRRAWWQSWRRTQAWCARWPCTRPAAACSPPPSTAASRSGADAPPQCTEPGTAATCSLASSVDSCIRVWRRRPAAAPRQRTTAPQPGLYLLISSADCCTTSAADALLLSTGR